MALVKEYFELTKKYIDEYGENTVLLMQVGSFMECYGLIDPDTREITGSKIQEFSRICELNIAEKNVCVGKSNVVMAGVTVSIVEKLIKKLQDAGYTIVVYVQNENVKNTTRSLAGIFSPGTYFQNETQNLTNNISCIWVEIEERKTLIGGLPKGTYVNVGISNIDIYTSKSSIFEFTEPYTNNPTNFDELERFISIHNPSEVIIITNMCSSQLDSMINFVGIQAKLVHKIYTNTTNTTNTTNINTSTSDMKKRVSNCEKQTFQKEILNRFFIINDYDSFIENFMSKIYATQSYCFLLDFVYQHNPYLVKKISEPIFENCDSRLVLANHSLKQLNIINDGSYNGKYSSVINLLNACITPMGKRKFSYNILNPTTNIKYLNKEYDITEHVIKNFKDYGSLRETLREMKDIAKWNRQVMLKKISPSCFFTLHKNLEIVLKLYEFIKKDNYVLTYIEDKLNLKENLKQIEIYCEEIRNYIEKNLDISICSTIDQISNFETNFINKYVDEELDKKMETLMESSDKLNSIRIFFNNILAKCETKSSSKSVETEYFKIHETEKNSFSLVGTKRRCTLLKDELNKISKSKINISFVSTYTDIEKSFDLIYDQKTFELHTQTASNNSIYTPQINELCKNVSSVKIQLKDVLNKVYNTFVESFEEYKDKIEYIVNFITNIDIIISKAYIAKNYNYCKPIINSSEKSFVNVKGLRHCLIEHLQQNELYVTNDINIGDGMIDGILLYGTNAVGKTSLIRALGISVIMAQAGLYVPASEFVYNPYSYIFTRILGNDNIFKGLSSFAVEMSELRTILRLSNEKSLILGDELCSGTESISATSIFVAGIQSLNNVKSSYIFATHLHEILDYDEIKNLDHLSIKHMTVFYNKDIDALVYDRKLKDGPGTNMYGLEVCKSLNLPQDFLDTAHNIRMKYHPESSSLLSSKQSQYNNKQIISMCEKCGKNMGTEVHHLIHQNKADDTNNINYIDNSLGVFNKNHKANLMTLCEDCHKELHNTKKVHKKVKTTKGYKITEV